MAIDEQGMLYVGSEYERQTATSRKNGKIMKLDPSKPDDPLVWSIQDHDALPAGVWATPAIDRDMVLRRHNGGPVARHRSDDRRDPLDEAPARPTWQSPVVVDNTLIEGEL